MYGRVRIYNLGFAVFSAASVTLSVDPFTGGSGALWLIGWRVVQAFGGSMLMANSAAVLTDAFPEHQRGMALGINQIAGISGQFIGLLLGGLLALWDWRAVFWVSVPIGVSGTVWAYRSLGELAARPTALTTGLRAQQVPLAAATKIAHLPPISALFAALLGYNPVRTLLAPIGLLRSLPAPTSRR